MTPLTYTIETFTNLAQQQGTTLASGATMKNAATQTDAMPPLILGGLDRSLIRSELIGNPGAGGIAQSYLTNGPYVRNAYFDLAGAMGVAGPQPFLAEDKTYPVNVRLERTTQGQDSVQDLLQQMLVEYKALNYYIRELPQAIAAMNQLPNPQAASNPASMQDDSENFADDPTTYLYRKGH
jgi:hypothetical protein